MKLCRDEIYEVYEFKLGLLQKIWESVCPELDLEMEYDLDLEPKLEREIDLEHGYDLEHGHDLGLVLESEPALQEWFSEGAEARGDVPFSPQRPHDKLLFPFTGAEAIRIAW